MQTGAAVDNFLSRAPWEQTKDRGSLRESQSNCLRAPTLPYLCSALFWRAYSPPPPSAYSALHVHLPPHRRTQTGRSYDMVCSSQCRATEPALALEIN